MSFWPFTNSFNNNSQLQKFLDGVQDFTTVKVEDLVEDATLLLELMNELQSVKSQYSNSNGFMFSQLLQQSDSGTNGNNFGSSNTSLLASDTDSNSITSSNDLGGNGNNTKDARGAKLVELLIQPHILSRLLDYIVESVDFFHELNEKEAKELESLLNEVDHEQNKQEDDTGNPVEDMKDEKENDQDDPEIDSEEHEEYEHQHEEHEHDEEPEDEEEPADEKLKRCIQVSADILSIDLWVVSNRIIETKVIIDKLWLVLSLENLVESSPTVNHMVRILDQLMNTNSIELLNYIRTRENLVDTFLNKLEVPMLMDFFLRVIQSDKPDSPTGIIDILYAQDLIPKLVDVLKPHPSQFDLFDKKTTKLPNHELIFKQTAATDFIKALITISSNTALAVGIDANIGPNQLTRQLVSKEIVTQMVYDIMLYTIDDPVTKKKQTNKHGINNCVGIVIELIRKNNSDYDLNCGSYTSMLQGSNGEPTEINPYVMFQWLKDFEQNTPGPKDPIYLGDMLAIFSESLGDFCELMDLEPELYNIDPDSKILGFSKFRIAELIAELLHCSNMVLNNSKKIQKIVRIRDQIREKRVKRLRKALEEQLVDQSQSEDSSDELNNSGLKHDDSESTDPMILLDGENEDFTRLVDSLDIEEESDNDEPTISAENPFVCESRDLSFRDNACVGDYFKIKLIDSHILLNIISKFTQYPWHNFFHNVVFDLVQQIFNAKLNSYNSFLISHLFEEGESNLIRIIVDSYKEEYEVRPGYLGHLILISEEVVKFTSLYKPDLISPLIFDAVTSDEWEWFVNDVLLKTREVYNVVLGAESSEKSYDEQEDEDDDNDDAHYKYGFDASTTGFLDMDSYKTEPRKSRKTAKLRARNQEPSEVISEEEEYEGEGEDEDYDEAKDDNPVSAMSELRIQDMSPKPEDMREDDSFGEDFGEEVGQFSQDGFLENLSGSDSSDDDNDESTNFDENRLTRVKNHNA